MSTALQNPAFLHAIAKYPQRYEVFPGRVGYYGTTPGRRALVKALALELDKYAGPDGWAKCTDGGICTTLEGRYSVHTVLAAVSSLSLRLSKSWADALGNMTTGHGYEDETPNDHADALVFLHALAAELLDVAAMMATKAARSHIYADPPAPDDVDQTS